MIDKRDGGWCSFQMSEDIRGGFFFVKFWKEVGVAFFLGCNVEPISECEVRNLILHFNNYFMTLNLTFYLTRVCSHFTECIFQVKYNKSWVILNLLDFFKS